MAKFSLATDPHLVGFREAAGLAALYEMGVRLLADKTGLESVSLAFRFQDTEDAVRERFKSNLSDEDRRILDHARPLRNKLLHGELRVARARVAELYGPEPQRVRKAVLPDVLTVDALLAAVDTARALEDDDPQEGNLFGWLLQMNTDGTVRNAAEVFYKAIAIVDRLMLQS